MFGIKNRTRDNEGQKPKNQKIYKDMHHIIGTIKPINWYTMLTKKQLALLKPFQGASIFREYGVRELARAANEKSNNAVQIALKQFVKEDIVSERKLGTSRLYGINLMNDLSFEYMGLLKYEGLPKEVIYTLEELKKEIEKYTFFYSMVVFGSYAIGKQTKKSDLDIAIFVQNKFFEKDIKIAINLAETKALLPLHVEIITNDDFFEMLTNKEANLGKEVAKKHRAVHNLGIFYKMIKEAAGNGYRY